MKDGLDGLRERYPGWTIRAKWVARASAGDYRKVRAERGGIVLEALGTEEMAVKMRLAEVSKKSE